MALSPDVELSPTTWVRKQTETILRTGTTDGVEILGRPVVLITMIGAKSKKVRKVPLMRVEHDGSYAMVASKGGAPDHPQWYYNVIAEPDVEVQDGSETGKFRAREVTGDEKSVWWDRAVDAYPPYAEYQTKTSRPIPVFVLDPIG